MSKPKKPKPKPKKQNWHRPKRGRPPLEDRPRDPNGRIVEAGRLPAREDAMAVGIEARERVYGLSKDAAKSHEAVDAIGRLRLQGTISKAQLEAAERYRGVVKSYHLAIGAPPPLISAGYLDRGRGYDSREGTEPDYVERCDRARRDMGLARGALLEAGAQDGMSLVPFAVNTWVLEDEESWSTVGELRIGLNALARLYRVEDRGISEKAA